MADTKSALDGIRVLDLTTALGEPAGRVFADLGAEVIKLEPPGGCEARITPPFERGHEHDPEGSLFWRAWGLGKRSVVLDLANADDKARLLALARGADVLLESFAPGTLAALGLGAGELRRENPSLIYVSITPFGCTTPDARGPASDLTLAAAGGLLNMQGDRDRAPLPIGFPEASCHGAVQAAADAILALWERDKTGLGQHLDVSQQAAVVWTLLFVTGHATLYGEDLAGWGAQRGGPAPQLMPGVVIPPTAACKDGFVGMTLVLGEPGARSFGAMLRFAGEEGALSPEIAAREWSTWLPQMLGGKLTPAEFAQAIQELLAFLATRTKAELQERAVAGRWLLAPAWNAADLVADPQLAARDYWQRVEDTLHPGPFAKLSATPIRYRRAAPKLGQDQHLAAASQRKPQAPAAIAKRTSDALFAGLKVADFSWVGAGPLVSKDLANLGATVVRVESDKHVDALRMVPPWKDRAPNPATAHTAANFNQSKLGLALDLAQPGARGVAERLVDWADVMVESFTPGTAAKHGLDWASVSLRKPGLVMLSSCLRGQTGPERGYTGFGLQGASLAGFVAISGYPDRLPSAPWGAYTDFIAPRYSLAALGAALYHRARTGEGQYIDLSQVEAAIHFLEPLVLDYTVNGRLHGLTGQDSERAAPHGVFAAAGEQRWIAIAAESAAQWRALRAAVPWLAPFDAPAFDSLAVRRSRKAEIEAPLAAWCREHEAFALAQKLRAAGVPAYVALRATDLHADPQLAQRSFFQKFDHPRVGPAHYDGQVTLFSETPARIRHAGPAVGQHSFEVLRDILGYSEDEITELAAADVLS